jgi:hypothetical protein
MKNSFKLHAVQEQKKKEDENAIDPKPCCICSKQLKGAYGRHMKGDEEVWTCSKRCEEAYVPIAI